MEDDIFDTLGSGDGVILKTAKIEALVRAWVAAFSNNNKSMTGSTPPFSLKLLSSMY